MMPLKQEPMRDLWPSLNVLLLLILTVLHNSYACLITLTIHEDIVWHDTALCGLLNDKKSLFFCSFKISLTHSFRIQLYVFLETWNKYLFTNMSWSVLLRETISDKHNTLLYNAHETLVNLQRLKVAATSDCPYCCKKYRFQCQVLQRNFRYWFKSFTCQKIPFWYQTFLWGSSVKNPFQIHVQIMSGC